jgi:hypothetical protein
MGHILFLSREHLCWTGGVEGPVHSFPPLTELKPPFGAASSFGAFFTEHIAGAPILTVCSGFVLDKVQSAAGRRAVAPSPATSIDARGLVFRRFLGRSGAGMAAAEKKTKKPLRIPQMGNILRLIPRVRTLDRGLRVPVHSDLLFSKLKPPFGAAFLSTYRRSAARQADIARALNQTYDAHTISFTAPSTGGGTQAIRGAVSTGSAPGRLPRIKMKKTLAYTPNGEYFAFDPASTNPGPGVASSGPL